jgi:formylglycine-generating enzyme required for sulfatase activity
MRISHVSIITLFLWAGLLFAGGELAVPKDLKKDYALVPAISLIEDSVTRVTMQVPAFYISKNEVSNLEYRKFVEAIRLKGDADMLKAIAVDTSVWHLLPGYAEHYTTHTAFEGYPVVGISHAAAVLYCQWLTDTYGAGKIEFRLPSRAEWLQAARGNYTAKAYAWGKSHKHGNTLKDKHGDYHCNFFSWYGVENVHYNDSIKAYELKWFQEPFSWKKLHSNFMYTAPKGLFSKNPFGLYHMNGNVAEMVQEPGMAVGGSYRNTGYDVRNESTKVFTKPAGDVGFRPVMVLLK